MPRLLEMLRGMKGVSVEKTEGYHCTNEPALSRKEGERLVASTLLPAYRDVLAAENNGIEYPDISELFRGF